jgi:hypothetical protein
MKKLLLITLLLLSGVGIAHADTPDCAANSTDSRCSPGPTATGQTCTVLLDGANTVSGKFDANGNCTTAPGPGGTTISGGGNILDASGKFAPAYTAPPSTPTPTSNPNQPNPNAFCAGGSCTYTPLEPLPGLPATFGCKAGDPNCQNSFSSLVGGAIRLFIWLGAIVAVVVLILGALTYMFSDVITNKTRAIARIRNAMWGILILASSWLILNTINPQLVNLNLKLDPFAPVVNGPIAGTSQLNQQDAASVQSQINACNARYAGGGTLHNANGTVTCIPNAGGSAAP